LEREPEGAIYDSQWPRKSLMIKNEFPGGGGVPLKIKTHVISEVA